jgi:hypothetical protein
MKNEKRRAPSRQRTIPLPTDSKNLPAVYADAFNEPLY